MAWRNPVDNKMALVAKRMVAGVLLVVWAGATVVLGRLVITKAPIVHV